MGLHVDLMENKKHLLSALLSSLVFLCMLASCREEKETPVSLPYAPENFLSELETQFSLIKTAEANDKKETVKKAHQSLMANYPVYYDWWLQDGGNDINWSAQSIEQGLKQRILRMTHANNYEPGPDTMRLMDQYLSLCMERRTTRLLRLGQESPRIVFTKFRVLRPSFFAYTEGLSDARHECNFFPGGELCELNLSGPWAETVTLIKSEDGVIRDPDVHFNGRHLLFSWKKSPKDDDFHLYEMDLSNHSTKQITEGKGYADFEGIYLPDGNILFNSTRCGTSVDCWFTEVSNLYLCDRNGQYLRQVGFDQVHTPHPSLMDDGRVIYTRWDYNDRAQMYTQPLFQMNPDGTGQAALYGMNSWFPTTIVHARQIPGTRKIMATMTGHHAPQHGKLGIINTESGREENEGIIFIPGGNQPEAERIDNYGQHGEQYQYPYPLTEKEFLISFSPVGYHGGDPMQFGIYWMNIDGERELLAFDPANSCNQPIPVVMRSKPFQRASHVDYTKEEGIYYLQNIYEGLSMKNVEPGAVKKLRIVELEYRSAGVGSMHNTGSGGGSLSSSPVGTGNTSWDVKKVLGTVDVHEDGSAFFSVPARKPLYFQALDKDGLLIQTMRSWSTLQPGEFQSCVGCHEHKNTVPLAQHPSSQAMAMGIQTIERDASSDRGFSFAQEIQPILDAHCTSCHDGQNSKYDLTSRAVNHAGAKRIFTEAYLNLTHTERRHWRADENHMDVNWISNMSEPETIPPRQSGSHTSRLVTKLKQGHGKTAITPREISRLALWIDLGVPFIGDYREANAWSEQEQEFYRYHDRKRTDSKEEEKRQIELYLESLAVKES